MADKNNLHFKSEKKAFKVNMTAAIKVKLKVSILMTPKLEPILTALTECWTANSLSQPKIRRITL